jgi:AcrR family transcriptional regulator
VFADRGTDARMEDVARAAEVAPATLYRRFATKDALVREVLSTFFGRLVELAGQALTEPPQRCRPLSDGRSVLATSWSLGDGDQPVTW